MEVHVDGRPCIADVSVLETALASELRVDTETPGYTVRPRLLHPEPHTPTSAAVHDGTAIAPDPGDNVTSVAHSMLPPPLTYVVLRGLRQASTGGTDAPATLLGPDHFITTQARQSQ